MQRPFLSIAAIALFGLAGAGCASQAAMNLAARPPKGLQLATRR